MDNANNILQLANKGIQTRMATTYASKNNSKISIDVVCPILTNGVAI